MCTSRGLPPLLDAHTSSISRQNCRTPFALEVSEGKTVFCVISRISQFQLGWALKERVLDFCVHVCVVIFLVVINYPFFLIFVRSTIRSYRKGSCLSLL